MKKILLFVWEIVKISIISLAIVIPIRYFIFQPFIVSGESMEPNFSSGDYFIVDQISYRFKAPERGDVAIFSLPSVSSRPFIKRIIGLPGEKVEIKDGRIIIENNNEIITLEEEYLSFETRGNTSFVLEQDEYFVLGDNREFSYDSRRFGPIKKENIVGKAFIRLWPISSLTKITAPSY